MGSAVWEFMWCLDKITKIDEDGIGWILGGKPINLKDIKEELGITEPKISKNLNKLKNEGYLNLRRTPYGLVISVNKAKKRFAQKVKPVLTKRANLNVLKGKSNIGQDSRQDSKTSVSQADKEPFSYKTYLEELIKAKRKDIHIIGLYWEAKNFCFSNKFQCGSAIRRELRAAKNLIGYPDDRIIAVMKHLKDNADFKWVLETVHKYIDEDLNILKKKDWIPPAYKSFPEEYLT